MTAFVNTNFEVLVDSVDIAGFASTATLDVQYEEIDITSLASGVWRQKIQGLGSCSWTVEGFQSFTSVEPSFPGTSVGLNTITVAPQNGGSAIGDAAYFGQARTVSRTPLAGAVGDVAGFSLNWAGTGQLARGQILHPLAARTATGNGTVTTFTTPTAGQFLCASFHVTAVTGSGSITFTVATDDAVGFASPTTRITSAAMTAVGGQFVAVAGPFAGETHIRPSWTITGFTSVSFVIAAGLSTTPA